MVWLSDLHKCCATLLESHFQASYLQPNLALGNQKRLRKKFHQSLRLGKIPNSALCSSMSCCQWDRRPLGLHLWEIS